MISELPENLKYDSTFHIVWRDNNDNQVRYLPGNPLQDTESACKALLANYFAHAFCDMSKDSLKLALDLCMVGKFSKLLESKHFVTALKVRGYDARRFLVRLLVLIEDNVGHFDCLIKNQRGDFAKFKIYNLKDSQEAILSFMKRMNEKPISV